MAEAETNTHKGIVSGQPFMDNDDIQHLDKLIQAYIQRLRVLELKEAIQGLDTPPHILLEMEGLRHKIEKSEAQLQNHVKNSMLNTSANSTNSSDKIGTLQIEIVLHGNFDGITPEMQRAAIRAFAAILELSLNDVKIIEVKSGSIIFRIEVPEGASDKLPNLYSPSSREMGVAQVSIAQVNKDLILNAIRQINDQLGWHLSEEDLERYAQNISNLFLGRTNILVSLIYQTIINYHAEHHIVETLANSLESSHNEKWNEWVSNVVRIMLLRGGVTKEEDLEDITQEALLELWRALSSYRYETRFSTWAYAVISRSALRQYRSSHAQKRLVNNQSLQDFANIEEEIAVTTGETTDETVMGNQLAILLQNVLDQQDKRIGKIFYLWAIADKSTREISSQLQIHPSRVQALLAQARQLLQANSEIQDWLGDKPLPSE